MVVVGEGGTRDKVNWGKKKLSVREGLLKKRTNLERRKKVKKCVNVIRSKANESEKLVSKLTVYKKRSLG